MAIRSTAEAPASDAPPPVAEGAVQQRRRMRARWAVHLSLLALFAASLATATAITEGTPHLVVGLAFVALVAVHIVQRRHTVTRLAATLGRARAWLGRRGRLAWSDLVLALLALNLLASGTYDWVAGYKVMLHPRSLGIPLRDMGWHVASALVLLVSLCVHVGRRRGRLRRSVVR